MKADVVFGMFGYNESFDTKPEDYKTQLIEFVKKTRGTKPNGKSFPRIVLFSPIAHEDTRNPNVPDGKAHNAQLEAYHESHCGCREGSGRGVCRSIPSLAGDVQGLEGASHHQWRASHR